MIKAILFFIVLVSIYFGLYILNHRTPRPEGCEIVKDCANCNVTGCMGKDDNV